MRTNHFVFIIASFIAFSIFANGNTNKHNLSEKKQSQFTQSQKSNGLCFTPNKGQIIDMAGQLCPNVLYKGDGGGADIYLRKTGISYVFSNSDQVIHEVGEQVEGLIKVGAITETDEQKKKPKCCKRKILKFTE